MNTAIARTATRSLRSTLQRRYLADVAQGPEKAVKEAVANPKDSRVFPRAAVLLGAGALVGTVFYKTMATEEPAVEDRHNVIDQHVPPSQSVVAQKVSETMPKIMDAERYEKIKTEGLGVDHQQWKKENKSSD